METLLQKAERLGIKPEGTPTNAGASAKTAQSSFGFGERLRMSFGSPEAREKLKEREAKAGLRGKFDLGDIADVAGTIPTIVGGAAGAYFTPIAPNIGAGIGAGLGDLARQAVGQAFGVQDSFNLKEAGATAGMTAVGGWGLGKLFNVVAKTIPNKLMSTIFKQSADDIAAEVKSGGSNLVQSEEVLREGFKGNSRKMMEFALKTMDDLDEQARGATTGKFVSIPIKQTISNTIKVYLDSFKGYAKKFGFEPEVIKEGNRIIGALNAAKGNKVPAEVAYSARKFIYKVMKTSAFKSDAKLGPMQAMFKNRAFYLKDILAKQLPGFAKIMNKYSIHINAFEDLAKYAASTQNRDLFDLLDVFIMYGINPTAYLARRGLTSAGFKTGVAQTLYQGGKMIERVLPKGVVPSALSEGARRFFEQ